MDFNFLNRNCKYFHRKFHIENVNFNNFDANFASKIPKEKWEGAYGPPGYTLATSVHALKLQLIHHLYDL